MQTPPLLTRDQTVPAVDAEDHTHGSNALSAEETNESNRIPTDRGVSWVNAEGNRETIALSVVVGYHGINARL
jgi:hypothetical protein